MLKRLLAFLLFVSVLTSIFVCFNASVASAFENYEGSNIDAQSYDQYAKPVNSYLTKTKDGYMRVQADAVGQGILVEYYNSSFKRTGQKTVPSELPIFGAFYSTGSNYYILSGQNNPAEDDGKEVIRVTKYDTSWNRLSSIKLNGENTTEPISFGTARMTHSGKYLFIRTCHVMYKRDGVNHQANLTLCIDTERMTVTDSCTGVFDNSYGYISHSFNQFIKVDSKNVVAFDHGDEYPRSLVFVKYNNDCTDGKFMSYNSCRIVETVHIPGRSGDNYTGISVGGFEVSSTSYLTAYNSVDIENYETSETRNIFISVINKNTFKVTNKKITDLTELDTSASTPHLVKIDDSRFVLMWSYGSKVHYRELDANGNTVGVGYRFTAELSDCAPIVANGKIIWYTWKNGKVYFNTISTSNLSGVDVCLATDESDDPSQPDTTEPSSSQSDVTEPSQTEPSQTEPSQSETSTVPSQSDGKPGFIQSIIDFFVRIYNGIVWLFNMLFGIISV